MTRKAWFCYEGDNQSPVIYYDFLPTTSVNGKETVKKKKQVVEISHLLDVDGKAPPLFMLVKDYPMSKVLDERLKKPERNGSINQQETKMVRPVSGFQTSQGTFYETEREAVLFEASFALHEAVTDAVAAFGVDRNEPLFETFVDGVKDFVSHNEKVVKDYLEAKAAFTVERDGELAAKYGSKKDDGLDGQSAGDSAVDDPSVRSEDNQQVDSPPDAEDQSSTTGTTTHEEPDLTSM